MQPVANQKSAHRLHGRPTANFHIGLRRARRDTDRPGTTRRRRGCNDAAQALSTSVRTGQAGRGAECVLRCS